MVREAIVAIPYIPMNKEGSDELELKFVEFHRDFYQAAVNNRNKRKNDLNRKLLSNQIRTIEDYKQEMAMFETFTKSPMSDAPINAIEYQLNMMDDFILPPELDFNITGRNPYMMYFFQFHASFNKDDIARVWQNMYPKSPSSTGSPRYSYSRYSVENRNGTKMYDTSYVGHYLDTVDLNGLFLSPVVRPKDLFVGNTEYNTRWLIFKVKERGVSNLEEVRLRSIDQRISNIDQGRIDYVKEYKSSRANEDILKGLPGFRTGMDRHVRFNWPYDYFSFVELIKLETKIDSYNSKK